MSLTLVTAPELEPVTLAEAKEQTHVDGTDEDTYLAGLVTTARTWAEGIAGRSFINTTWDWKLDHFPMSGDRWLHLPRAPVSAITSVTYLNSSGVSTTWASSNYVLSGNDLPPRLALAPGVSWPTTESERINAVTVRFVAGYGATVSSVPEPIRHAIKLRVADLHANRESETTGTIVSKFSVTAEALLSTYRVWW